MSERQTRYGVTEYLELDETTRPQELVWGIVRDAPSPAPSHQDAVFHFARAWYQHVEAHGLGRVLVSPMDCVLDRERGLIVQPDALFVSAARDHIVTDRVWGAPDLVLEVLSPKPRLGTLTERLAWFASYGVRECWLYRESERRLDVVEYSNGVTGGSRTFDFHDRIVSAVFPAFDLSCAAILTSYLPRLAR